MTKEEAVKKFREIRSFMKADNNLFPITTLGEAIDMAIFALSADGDLINRTDAIREVEWALASCKSWKSALMTLPSADVVSREDYHNLLMASDDIDRALREYQAKDENPSAEAASREPLDIFARMYRAERESARSDDAEAVSADRPHGEWIEKNSHTYICDHCGFEQAIYGNLDEYNYCPNCGAKMKAR